jgi:hypothetical protein
MMMTITPGVVALSLPLILISSLSFLALHPSPPFSLSHFSKLCVCVRVCVCVVCMHVVVSVVIVSVCVGGDRYKFTSVCGRSLSNLMYFKPRYALYQLVRAVWAHHMSSVTNATVPTACRLMGAALGYTRDWRPVDLGTIL